MMLGNEYNEVADINNDNSLDIFDIIMLVNIILGSASPPPNADINADDIINILDIIFLVNIILA